MLLTSPLKLVSHIPDWSWRRNIKLVIFRSALPDQNPESCLAMLLTSPPELVSNIPMFLSRG